MVGQTIALQSSVSRRGRQEGLFVFFLNCDGFQVFGLENLAAIEAFQVFHAISSGDHLGTVVVTSGLHNQHLDETYFIQEQALVKPPSVVFAYQELQFW